LRRLNLAQETWTLQVVGEVANVATHIVGTNVEDAGDARRELANLQLVISSDLIKFDFVTIICV
jgi:hypothetical protein